MCNVFELCESTRILKREIHNSTTYTLCINSFITIVLWYGWLLELKHYGLIVCLLFVCRAGGKGVHLMNLGASGLSHTRTPMELRDHAVTSTQRSEAGSTESVASAS